MTAVAFAAATEAHRRGDLASAEAGYRGVIAREPRHAEALFWLGTIITQQGNAPEGVALLERALALEPRLPGGHHHLGNVYRRIGRTAEAAAALRRAAEAEPGNADAHNNLGGTLIQLEVYGEAERHLRRALEIAPNLRAAMANLAVLTEITGRHDETLAWYDRAIALKPDDADIRFQRAGALLIRGRLAEGFEEYRARFGRPQRAALYGKFKFPTWNGEALDGRHVLVWLEQGLGDEILASTMLPDLIGRAGRITVICSGRLQSLLARAFPAICVIPADRIDAAALDGIDVQASMSELGRWLRPSLAAFPKPQPYLAPEPGRAETLRAKYKAIAGDKMLVGISWRSKSPEAEREKSIPLSDWREILQTPGMEFVSLQYGDTARERDEAERATGRRVLADPSIDPVGDLEGLAAQIAAMDLVVSVSNTTVHLAGALGQPVWALIPSDRGRLWYWFLDRADSPWYARVRLFRKPISGGWAGVVADVAAALRGMPRG